MRCWMHDHIETIDLTQAPAMEDLFGPIFGLKNAPFLSVRPLDGAFFSATCIDYRHDTSEARAFVIPPCDIYLLMLYLNDAYHCDLASDGTATPVRRFAKGTLCVIDLSEGVSFRLHSDLNSIAFGVQRGLLEEVSELPQAPALAKLRCRRGDDDGVMRAIGISVLPLIERADAVAQATLRPIAIAIGAHLLQHHAGAERAQGAAAPLSPLQEKDAKDFIMRHFAFGIRVADIAASVGLSPDHFSKAFKSATGVTPHRWLRRYRVARARMLLEADTASLRDIAALCGFGDAGALIREMRREIGPVQRSDWDSCLH